jgi:hypothetical protein
MTEEHPRHRCHAASRKLSAPLGQGYYSTPRRPQDGGQKATQGAPYAGTTSSPEGFLACCCRGWPSVRSEPPMYRRHYSGDDSMQFQPHARNPHCGGGDDREGRNLSTEGSDPKAFGGAVRNACFP